MTNLDSLLKSRDITLSTNVHLVKAMVFPVVMYGCESWTVKKAEHQRMMLLKVFQNFPQFIVVHTVKSFGIVNKAEKDVFLELSCFVDDPADVSNLISDSSAFSRELKKQKHYFANKSPSSQSYGFSSSHVQI